MSIATEPVIAPKRAAWCTKSETFALQISFLLGRQLMLGQEPPMALVQWPVKCVAAVGSSG